MFHVGDTVLIVKPPTTRSNAMGLVGVIEDIHGEEYLVLGGKPGTTKFSLWLNESFLMGFTEVAAAAVAYAKAKASETKYGEVRGEHDACTKEIKDLTAHLLAASNDRDDALKRANLLSDMAGALETEKKELLLENVNLRRKGERLFKELSAKPKVEKLTGYKGKR